MRFSLAKLNFIRKLQYYATNKNADEHTLNIIYFPELLYINCTYPNHFLFKKMMKSDNQIPINNNTDTKDETTMIKIEISTVLMTARVHGLKINKHKVAEQIRHNYNFTINVP